MKMKDKLSNILLWACVAGLLVLAGFFWRFVGEQAVKEKMKEEALAITAMYVEVGSHGDYMFVQQDPGTETVFRAELPEREIYEIREGKEWKIKREKLVSGDILKIYGDGVMTLSYPGQYPGVTRMVRIYRGEPEDTEKYQEMLKEMRPAFDPEAEYSFLDGE